MTDLPYRPCVGVTLINPSGLIFAGRRLDGAPQAWQMPQGGIDEGEKPRAAGLRELAEERIPSIVYSVGPRVLVPAHLPQWLCWDKRREDASGAWS